MQKRVLAINDISCYGRCALTVSLPVLSAAGVECAIMPTAVLSTHLAYPGPVNISMTEHIGPIAGHFDSIGVEFDAVAAGYLDNAAQTGTVLDILKKHKSAGAFIMADPTMADNGKMYGNPAFDNDFLEGMKKIVSISDLTVPNITEAAFLCGMPYLQPPYDKAYIEGLLTALLELGAKSAVVTGVTFEEGLIGCACMDKKGGPVAYYFDKKYSGRFIGTGDLFAAALLGAILNGFSLTDSAKTAASFLSYAINKTLSVNTKDSMAINFEQSLPFYMKELGIGI